MLSDARFEASLPCSDLQRAKSFYAEKLGLSPSDEGPAGAFYAGRGGTRFILFPSSGSASGSHSQMGFMVADITAEVRDLRQRGVQFQDYDLLPWLRQGDGNSRRRRDPRRLVQRQ